MKCDGCMLIYKWSKNVLISRYIYIYFLNVITFHRHVACRLSNCYPIAKQRCIVIYAKEVDAHLPRWTPHRCQNTGKFHQLLMLYIQCQPLQMQLSMFLLTKVLRLNGFLACKIYLWKILQRFVTVHSYINIHGYWLDELGWVIFFSSMHWLYLSGHPSHFTKHWFDHCVLFS